MNGRRESEILDAKIALEFELMGPLDRLGMSYIRAIEHHGGPVAVNDRLGHIASVEKVLLRHYARVVSVFQGKTPTSSTSVETVAVSLQHLESLKDRASFHAGLFIRSIDKAWADAMRGEQQDHDDGTTNYAKGILDDFEIKADTQHRVETPKVRGATVSYYGKIKAAVGKVIGKFKSKLGGVAAANTNPVAEQTRGLEIVAPEDANGHITKTWMSLMDGRERDWHHEAHEQTVRVGTPFSVGPDQLRFPGDTELGASLANIINCRCYLVYDFVGDDGSKTELYKSPSASTRRFRRKPNPNHPVRNFQGGSEGPPLNPTSVVTLNGTTRARIVLGDGRTLATLRQETPSTIVVSIGRQVIARATLRGGKAINIKIDPKFKDQGIRGLIERSAEHSATMDRTPYSQRVPQ